MNKNKLLCLKLVMHVSVAKSKFCCRQMGDYCKVKLSSEIKNTIIKLSMFLNLQKHEWEYKQCRCVFSVFSPETFTSIQEFLNVF